MGCGSSAVLGRKATAVTHQGYSDTVVADGGNFRTGDGQRVPQTRLTPSMTENPGKS